MDALGGLISKWNLFLERPKCIVACIVTCEVPGKNIPPQGAQPQNMSVCGNY